MASRALPTHKMSRRPHAKVRTGCGVCKARKVKVGPSTALTSYLAITVGTLMCFMPSAWPATTVPYHISPYPVNSERHGADHKLFQRGEQCEYEGPIEPPTSNGNGNGNSRSGSVPHAASPHVSAGGGSDQVLPSFSPLPQFGDESFSLLDMELLHQFTSSTCMTFSVDPLVRNFWRIDFVQMGFTHRFLLRSTLALAALHLAHHQTRRREALNEAAMIHHSAASSAVVPLISNMSSDNAIPVFLFSVITSFIAFASPKEPDNLLVISNGVVPEWLLLFRGVRSMLYAYGGDVRASPLGMTMLRTGHQTHEIWMSKSLEHDALKELEVNLKGHVTDPKMSKALLNVVDCLKRCYQFIYGNGYTDDERMRSISILVFKVDDEFIELLKGRQNEALCVLAFFCVPLHRMGFMWFVEGWGLHLIQSIYTALDPGFRAWIRWPIEETGWVP
ncbi:hypothetical protein S7711_03758 [Stachybotrys chartarum IBT 7711]|uniref:Uncharacterized protein n=1 Tax=Stachybotrys chartarum (strain CBS 109288 / IBT 7711) TaxID=1280523 RepID=A0A084AWV0_STACB|nr:hypothetical protein S7711_03758 [Stachybotrys chartarum IBT 7711]